MLILTSWSPEENNQMENQTCWQAPAKTGDPGHRGPKSSQVKFHPQSSSGQQFQFQLTYPAPRSSGLQPHPIAFPPGWVVGFPRTLSSLVGADPESKPSLSFEARLWGNLSSSNR